MNLSFESLAVTNVLNLYEFLMDIHHNTSLTSILEENSISSTSRAHICSCSGKGARLWLIHKPSIFISTLHFHLGLIQPLTFNLFMCEHGHGLDASGTHLIRCPFGG